MSKKIALMIGALNSGGAERVVAHLSHALERRYDVHLVLFEDSMVEYDCGGTLHNLNIPAKGGNPLVKIGLLKKRVSALKRVIREENIECVISFLDSPNFVNLLAKVKGCRKIISVRNYSGLENRQNYLLRLTDVVMKHLYRRADCVVTVSKLIEEDFRKHYHIPASKIRTIYNPYNFENIHQKGAECLSDEERLFFNNHFVFCNVGRVMYQKGIWHLVKAFAEVHNVVPHARLVIVGEDLSNGKLTPLIDELGVADSVLLTGRVKNPYKYMKNSQCYVLSSLFEGFPNAMVEAMACGCPIIAADCKSGPREILYKNTDLSASIEEITRADYGIIVPDLEHEENWNAVALTENEKKLAEAMLSMINNERERGGFAALAEQRSRDFDLDTCREAYENVIEVD